VELLLTKEQKGDVGLRLPGNVDVFVQVWYLKNIQPETNDR
jgi:hypothetical protein